MDAELDESLVNDFIVESRDHLNNIEPALLDMEQQGAAVDSETVNLVFRAMHTIKGGASFLKFRAVKELSHALENVLGLVRDGKLKIESDLMDLLLASVDKLRKMMEDVKQCDSVDIRGELERLHQVVSPGGDSGHNAGSAAGAAKGNAAVQHEGMSFNTPSLRVAAKQGMHFYLIKAFHQKDLHEKGSDVAGLVKLLGTFGKVFSVASAQNFDPEFTQDIGAELYSEVLFGSVLELDMIVDTLPVPVEQVQTLDLKSQLQASTAAPAPAPASEATHAATPAETPAPTTAAPGTNTPTVTANKENNETLRVRVDVLTRLMNLAGELVLARNQLIRTIDDNSLRTPGLQGILQNVDLVTSELQEGIMQTRMQPVGTVFGKFPRVLRDTSRMLGKEIDLVVQGAELELDKSIVELLGDPLVHIMRNCADHAIELPDDRAKLGKPRVGNVTLKAYHEGGQAIISISDDGRGMEPQRILKKALEKGMVRAEEAKRLSDREILNLVLAPGFSTAEKITEVSGRGVGMDVVRSNIEKIGGTIELNSKLNVGTTVLLRLPLTLAIIPSLIVGSSGQRFAVPQVSLVEMVWVRAAEVKQRIEEVHGAAVLRLRGNLLPLVRLSDVLGIPRTFVHPETGEILEDRRLRITDPRGPSTQKVGADGASHEKRRSAMDRRQDWKSDHNILVLKVGLHSYGLIVDELNDTEEIVVKPMSAYIKGCKTFAGATILGDGRITMILDVTGIALEAKLQFPNIENEEKRRRQEQDANSEQIPHRSVILCNGADEEYFAIPQEQIMRLERIGRNQIERIGNREYIQYRGEGLPIVRMEDHLPVSHLPEHNEYFVIIPKPADESSNPAAGILVSNIIDATDVAVKLDKPERRMPGLEGKAIVGKHLTTFIRPSDLLNAVLSHGDEA